MYIQKSILTLTFIIQEKQEDSIRWRNCPFGNSHKPILTFILSDFFFFFSSKESRTQTDAFSQKEVIKNVVHIKEIKREEKKQQRLSA